MPAQCQLFGPYLLTTRALRSGGEQIGAEYLDLRLHIDRPGDRRVAPHADTELAPGTGSRRQEGFECGARRQLIGRVESAEADPTLAGHALGLALQKFAHDPFDSFGRLVSRGRCG